MNETQRNIKQYKAALPGLRERIAASAMLLLVSLSMVVSASFAWYTISAAPEVSLIATTVASNGNLEIALAHGTVQEDMSKREEPDEVALGDSSSAENQTLVGSNITWGNLVNLSDISYGMSEISMRPAMLTDNNQSRTPLKGVDYTLDGRIIESKDYYRYATYDASFGSFRAGEGQVQYGLRAISSMILSNDEEQSEINEMGAVADEKFDEAKKAYDDIIKGNAKTESGESCMDSLVKLLETFVNDKASDVAASSGTVKDVVGEATYTPADYGPMVADLRDLMIAFQRMLEKESEAIRSVVNIYLFNQTGQKEYITKGEELREYGRTASGRKTLQDLGVPGSLLDALKTHVSDYDVITATIDEIQNHLINERVKKGYKVYWDSDYMEYQEGKEAADAANTNDFLNHYISNLVDLNNTYVGPIKNSDTGAIKYVPVMKLSGLSDAQTLLKAKPIEVEIRKGILKNTEARLGPVLSENSAPDDMNKLGKRIEIVVDVNLKVDKDKEWLLNAALSALNVEGKKPAAVRTDAGRDGSPVILSAEIGKAKRLVPEPKNMISKDIYGFAIDLWARTNARDTILTLEGFSEYTEERATCIDVNGATRELWTATGTIMEEIDGEMVEVEHEFDAYIIYEEVYKLDEEGNPIPDADGNPEMVWVNNVYDALGHGIIGIQENMTSEEGGGYSFKPKMVKVYTGYYGENRVWQELVDGGAIPQDSTTQGTGSCYVFYASPTEQPKILEMLDSFTVAFIDGKDNLVATAKLDTSEAFDINGKVTVPLKVVTGVAYSEQAKDSEELVNKTGIMKMPWNEATWLTAIVYLDGDEISNSSVLAAGSIEGRLNIQFGSSVDINSQRNDELLIKYRRISAVVKGNNIQDDGSDEVPKIQFDYDKNPKSVTVEVTIDGDQPTNVTAFFTRMVGKNQGTRMEAKTLTRVGDTKVWTADFELIHPGEYRLSTVIADGTEYVLDKKPGVEIKGQTISEIICNPSGGSVMTSADYYDVRLDMSITTATQDLQPKSVSVLFTYGNGRTATANMYPSGGNNWSGNLRVTESGNYIMSYLVIDGNEDLVDQQTSIFVRVGMDVQVTCDSILGPDGSTLENQSKDPSTFSILFEPPGEDSAYTARLRVELFDGSGAEIERMSGLKLVYPLESDKSFVIDGDMYWVENSGGYYQVEVPFKEAGTYVFGSVQMDDETVLCNITSASEAVKISAVPPDPPMLTAAPNNTVEFQYVPNSSTPATMSVTVFDSKAAIVQAEIVNLITGQSGWVDMTRKSVASTDPNHKTLETYTAVIPKNNHSNQTGTVGIKNEVDGQTIGYVGNCNGSQDGIWVLKQLRMQQVTDENENYYPADDSADAEYLYFDMEAYGIRTEVMEKVFYSFTHQTGVEYTSTTLSGGVLETHEVSGVKFKISDWRGSTEHLRNVKLNVTHGGDSGDKGGYTINTAVADQVWLENSSAAENNLKDLKLQVAGTYSVSLSYGIVVDGTGTSSYGPKPTGLTFTVTSQTPTVTITAASNAGGTVEAHKDTVTTGGEHSEGVQVPNFTSTSAEVYISCEDSYNALTCTTTHKYSAPTVTIKLDGIGSADSAELIFTPADSNTDSNNKSTAYIYANGQHTGSYTWDGNKEVSRTIGSGSTGNKHAAETVIGKTLVLKGAGYECTFTLTENTQIVINNPF